MMTGSSVRACCAGFLAAAICCMNAPTCDAFGLNPLSTSRMSTWASSARALSAKGTTEEFPSLEGVAIAEKDVGLKVGANSWKWPLAWPFNPSEEYFDRESQEEDPTPRMDKCLTPEAEQALQGHYERFLADGMDVLELGSGAHSYVPESLRLNRLVGVGLNEAELKANSKLTDIKVQDLNAVTQLAMPDESFDAVLIPNSIEFLLNPRAVLREAWRVLRPEGRCIVAFTSKDAYREYRKTQIKMWKDMNDAQHMWIVGSFFRFSADDSWEDLKGYELTPEGAKAGMSGGPGWEAYVVQAAKSSPFPDDLVGQLKYRLRPTRSMMTEDVEFCSLRLAAFAQERGMSPESVMDLAKYVPRAFEVIDMMPSRTLFPPYKSLLTTRLVCNGWTGTDAQMLGLKQGLGLETPSEEFWLPLGKATQEIHPEDRVLLIAEFTPLLGTPEESVALRAISMLPDIISMISQRLPAASKEDVQLLATDLIITDFLPTDISGSERDGFLDWLRGAKPEQMAEWLQGRKGYKQAAGLPNWMEDEEEGK